MRPKPKIIEECVTRDWWTWTIIEPTALYQVVFRGEPFVLRREPTLKDNKKKYPKTVYPHAAYAQHLADKLNKLFHTSDFTVRKL